MGIAPVFSKQGISAWIKIIVFVILTFTTPFLSAMAATLPPPTVVSPWTESAQGQSVSTTTDSGINYDINSPQYHKNAPLALEANQCLITASPVFGLTIITHGYQFFSGFPDWVGEMAIAIANRFGGISKIPIYTMRITKDNSGQVIASSPTKDNSSSPNFATGAGGAIIKIDWSDLSCGNPLTCPDTTSTVEVADAIFMQLATNGNQWLDWFKVPIHLIGHSRGASVNSRLAYDLGSYGIWVDHFTSLDPQPTIIDWEVKAYSSVLFADNYYQRYTTGIWGEHVAGTYEHNLTNIITDFLFYAYNCNGLPKLLSMYSAHEYIHTYYHGTINNDTCADDIRIESDWYLPKYPTRNTGYYFNRISEGNRYSYDNSGIPPLIHPRDGLHYQLSGSTNNRKPLSATYPAWSNATFKPFENQSNYNRHVGESFNFIYYYQDSDYADADSTLTITLSLDNDTNPFNDMSNSCYKEIGSQTNNLKKNTISTEIEFPWVPTDSDVGSHYVQIKAMDNDGHVRYDYLLEPINISPTTQLPSDLVVENLSVTPSGGEPGSTVTVSFAIRNNDDIAYPSRTNIRLSASSSNVTVNDALLASIEIPKIAKGDTYQVSQNVVIPGVSASGIYYVWVILDVNNEANQGGNTYNDKANQPFVVTVPAPPSAIGDFVQVYNTASGLRVRSPNACDSPLIGQNRFNGDTGKVIDGPQTCNIDGTNYAMWKIQWSDCLVGWSAQNWLKKIQSAIISCNTTYTIIRLEGDLNYGAVQVGDSVNRTMTIYNDGNSTLTVSSISYPPGFSGNWSGTIGAGSSRQVMVTFSPTEQKTYGGNVTVTSDASSGTNTRPVSGTGTITSTSILRLEGNLNFGEVQVGSNAQRPMTIYNDGNSTLTVSSIGYQEGFSGDWHGSIAAGSSRQVTVTFSPTATKAYSGDVIVSSDAISGANTLPASGTGIIAQTRTIRLTGDLNFGEVQVGHSASRTMTIFNDGNLTLTVNSISYATGFSGSWGSGTIAAGSPQLVTVTFSPTEEKTYSGNVGVNSNSTSGTNTLPVSGSGTIKSIFTLTVASSSPDSGINITVSPGDNNGKGSDKTQFTRTYNNNTPVKLTAPSTAGGKNFQKWQRNGVDWTTSQTANVTMDADYIMTAVYPTPVYTIGVGDQPFGVGVNPQTNHIYVANTASDNVSVIDGETNKAIATIGVGDEPKGVGVNPATNRIYVSNQISNTVSVIDGMSNKVVATVENVLSPIGIGVNPTTNRIYVTNFVSNSVSVIDGTSNQLIATVGVGMQPVGVDVNTQTNRIYIANANGGTVSVINGTNNQVVATVVVGNTPLFVGVNPQTNRIYVSDQNNDIVSVINGETNNVVATVGVGDQPMGIGVNPQTNRIYVANSGYSSSSVSVIDGAINQVVVAVGVEANTIPRGIGVNPQTNRTYVSNQGGDMVSVIDWQLPTPTPTITPTPTVTPTPTPICIIRLEGDLNFGEVQVGSSDQRTMTIYNDGNSVLKVSSISHPIGFSGNWSGTITAGSSQSVTMTFSPTEQKTYGGNVTVTSDATSGINTMPVSGTGTIKPISTMTVASSNPNSGVLIMVNPNDKNGQGNGMTQFTRSYNNNTAVTLTAPPTAGGNTFQKWQRNGVDLTTSQIANVTTNADYTMTAVYATVPTPEPTPTPTPIVQKLKVEKTIPQNGESGVNVDLEKLDTFFSLPMDETGFVNPFSAELKEEQSGTKITLSYVAMGGKEVEFFISPGSLVPDKIYRATIFKDRVRAQNGAMLEEDYTWTFSTGKQPPPTPTPEATGNISGIVTDAVKGIGINGATIELDTGVSTLTGTVQGVDGVYAVTGVSVGQHMITASALNYTSSSQTVTVVEGNPNPQTDANIFSFALISTLTPTPTPTCNAANLDAEPEPLRLKKEEGANETVTVTCEDGSPVAGVAVTSTVQMGKQRIFVSPASAVTDVNGQATFIITATQKTGNAKVRFEATGLRDTVKVKVVK